MELKWAERKRNEELVACIKNKNDMGIMPTTCSIYNSVTMAKATANKYLVVLRASRVLNFLTVGTTRVWYVAQDDEGNTLIPKLVFVKKE